MYITAHINGTNELEIGDGARRTTQTASERERRLQRMNASVREIHAAETAVEMEARISGSK